MKEIYILFAKNEGDFKRFLAAFSAIPTKEILENNCFSNFTQLEYAYLSAPGYVEQGSMTYWIEKYPLR